MQVVEGSPVAKTSAGAGEILTAIALAAFGFLITAGVLHASIRDPLHLHADVRSEKLFMMEQWRGKVFSAAFGTSHVHNGLDPRAFDAALTGSPAATRTANFAIEGGSQSEQFVMATEFLKHLEVPAQAGAPAQPCIVMLELGAGSNFTTDHLVHPRAINIYDWPTAKLISHFVSPQMGTGQRFGRIGYAMAAMGLHYSNVGMLSNEIFSPPLNQDILSNQTADDRRGELVEPVRTVRTHTIYDIIDHHLQRPVITPGQTLAGNAEIIERLAVGSPVRNVSFVYVVMPRLEDLNTAADYPDHLSVAGPHGSLDVPILNMARADRYPQMYDPTLWFDDSHLAGNGAQTLSTLLAAQLKAWYLAHGGPPPCG